MTMTLNLTPKNTIGTYWRGDAGDVGSGGCCVVVMCSNVHSVLLNTQPRSQLRSCTIKWKEAAPKDSRDKDESFHTQDC